MTGILAKETGNLHEKIVFGKIGQFGFKAQVKGIVPATFPVDSFVPIPMEAETIETPMKSLPNNVKHTYFLPSSRLSEQKTMGKTNAVMLPVYGLCESCREKDKDYKFEELPLGEDVPIIAISERIEGCTTEYFQSQRINSLLVWNEKRSRVLDLEWFEGNPDIGVSPEWFARSSREMSLPNAIAEFSQKIGDVHSLQNCHSYIYMTPLALAEELMGVETKWTHKIWQKEWKYSDPQKALEDLEGIIENLRR